MSDAPTRAYVGLGANLGDTEATLGAARDALTTLPGTCLVACSSWWRSAPVEASGPDFLNGVAALDTTLSPLELLGGLQAIELAHGRERPYRNAPRTLDLDLLLFGNDTIHLDALTVPHPRMLERAFVLMPLLEIVPDVHIPGHGPAREHIQRVSHQAVQKLRER